MATHTPHQKKVIESYYDNKEDIALGRLQEIVTELQLADTEGKRKRLWSRAAAAMKALVVPASVAEHIIVQRKPEVLARNLRQWLAASKDKKR